MAWSTFPTLTDGQVLTGAHMQMIRDNFNETAPAKITTVGSIVVGNGGNSIVERLPTAATVGTSQATAVTTYSDLGTVGPTVTVTTGVRALILWGCTLSSSGSGVSAYMSFAVSGATTVAATDASCVQWTGTSGYPLSMSRVLMQGLTPGSNTITAKYKVDGNTGTFAQRSVNVIPF